MFWSSSNPITKKPFAEKDFTKEEMKGIDVVLKNHSFLCAIFFIPKQRRI